MRDRTTGAVLMIALAMAGGCSTATTLPGTVAAPNEDLPLLPPAIHWVRTAAEHEALFRQVYGRAVASVQGLAEGRVRGRWGVILDADETVLDNSTYQRRLAEGGDSFSTESWNAWVREEAAQIKPGARDFIARVRELGGIVAIVTNRDAVVCDPTRRNLSGLGVTVDVVLCQQPEEEGKEGRFRAVQDGTAGLGPVEVVMWIGDNIQDFPGLDQRVRGEAASAFALFGDRYFILPNPMYGSWERNPSG